MATSLEEFQIPLQTQPQQPQANPRGKIHTRASNYRIYFITRVISGIRSSSTRVFTSSKISTLILRTLEVNFLQFFNISNKITNKLC